MPLVCGRAGDVAAPLEKRYGFEVVSGRIKEELKGKKIYISVDIDVLDTAYVPGTSNPERGGLTSMQLLSMLRGLAIQNEVIMVDFFEYSPLLDDRHYNTGILVNQLLRATLAGIAARKTGITDPDYIAPEMLSNQKQTELLSTSTTSSMPVLG